MWCEQADRVAAMILGSISRPILHCPMVSSQQSIGLKPRKVESRQHLGLSGAHAQHISILVKVECNGQRPTLFLSFTWDPCLRVRTAYVCFDAVREPSVPWVS
jgi:hypothetical protein